MSKEVQRTALLLTGKAHPGISEVHQATIENMKDQLIIVLLKRLGGKVRIPVAEVDDTGNDVASFQVDRKSGNFFFEVSKKKGR